MNVHHLSPVQFSPAHYICTSLPLSCNAAQRPDPPPSQFPSSQFFSSTTPTPRALPPQDVTYPLLSCPTDATSPRLLYSCCNLIKNCLSIKGIYGVTTASI
ncbi:uncharacterized protein LOC110664537 isoform X2 [Hevea brasiliensis]|uniref:uncharacterized protein LOC110664537 isoform X2 n=1 Tax=Hevea brasiliensis TaxID=3981 RepID=UPI0025E122E6|nr:uncharacterized protein LOC110664537 isoform X2 [Hevea brasiliensis]